MQTRPAITKHNEFLKLLNKSVDENGIRNAYRILMGIKEWDAPFNCDGYYSSVLYEFKSSKKLSGKDGRKALAQSCYYLRKFVLKGISPDRKGQLRLYTPPIKIVVASEKESFVVMTKDLESYFMNDKYDWTRTPSAPDEQLINDLAAVKYVIFHVEEETSLNAYLDALQAIGTTVLKVIDRDNFDSIFLIWKEEFASHLDAQRAALAFLLDLEVKGLANPDTGVVLFDFEGETRNVRLRVPVEVYKAFWGVYRRPPTAKELQAIYERKDRLVAIQRRRMDGEFFTPIPYCELAHDYLAKAIPDRYDGQGAHHSMYDDYNWWDCCSGAGNLTYHCPTSMQGELFISTLNQEDCDLCNESGQNPNAHIFRYDFLNQTDEELPKELREKLVPGSKWVFILNPPFAAGTGINEEIQSGVSDTVIGESMRNDKMSNACQNTFTQFMYRIEKITSNYKINIVVGIFSQCSYITSQNFSKFYNKWKQTMGFSGGFTFISSEFSGNKGKWPVVFATWNSNQQNTNSSSFDIYESGNKTGNKVFSTVNKPMNTSWAIRPKGVIQCPPLKGATEIITNEKQIACNKISENALGYIHSTGNDVRNSNVCFMVSSAASHGHGWSIIPKNFTESLLCLFARRITSPNWKNWQDEFSVPDINHPAYNQFKNDAIVWALFNGKNQSSSLGDISYKEKIYDIKNEFFWLTKDEFENIETMPHSIVNQASRSNERFVSQWLQDKTFSPDIEELILLGKNLVKVSAWARPHAEPKYQLMRWDAGWYQIRMGLFGKDVRFTKTAEMTEAMEKFQSKYKEITLRLRPYVYELGFLPKEIIFEEQE